MAEGDTGGQAGAAPGGIQATDHPDNDGDGDGSEQKLGAQVRFEQSMQVGGQPQDGESRGTQGDPRDPAKQPEQGGFAKHHGNNALFFPSHGQKNADLMDAHLTGASRSVPVVMLLDAHYIERAWWGPRPAPLQGWVIRAGRALTKEDRYREVRRWYARDRGITTLAELVAVLRAAGATRAA